MGGEGGGGWVWRTTLKGAILVPVSGSTIIIMIMIIAFKGAIQDLFTISSLRCEPSPTHTLKWPRRNRVQIMCNTSSAYHVQHVLLRGLWYEGTAQLLSLTEFKLHLFELYFMGWAISQWTRGGNWSTWRKPLAMSFKTWGLSTASYTEKNHINDSRGISHEAHSFIPPPPPPPTQVILEICDIIKAVTLHCS